MSLNGETPISFPTVGPDIFRHNQKNRIRMDPSQDGSPVTVTSGTVTVYSPNGTAIVNAQAVTPDSTGAYYDIAAGVLDKDLANIELGVGWQEVWSLTIAGTVYDVDRECALALRPLYPVTGDGDITGELPNYFRWTGYADGQAQRTAAFRELTRRWLREGGATYVAKSQYEFFEPELYLQIAKGLRNVGLDRDSAEMLDEAEKYQKRYEAAWVKIASTMDYDHDGRPDDPEVRSRPPSVIQRNAPAGPLIYRRRRRGY